MRVKKKPITIVREGFFKILFVIEYDFLVRIYYGKIKQ